MESTFTVEVDYTDRQRGSDGRYIISTRRVTVLASSPEEAQLIGTQLVCAIRDDIGGMPLASRIVL